MSKNILIIEDDKELSRALQAILELKRFYVVTANNGFDGINAIKKSNIDLVVCDISLPDIDGYDILKAVRNDKLHYQLPFIFLTAFAGDNNRRKGMNDGADDYITKPFDSKTLIDAINARLALNETKKAFFQEQLNKNWIDIINNNFKQEFLTPLNSLINATFLIESTPDQINVVDFKDAINAIYVSSFRIFRNTRNLIIFSIINNNEAINTEKHVFSSYVFLSDIVLQIIEYYNNGLTNNWKLIGQNIEYIPIKRYDSDYLNIIFTELIDNAVKYDSAKMPPSIHLSAMEDGRFEFCITNNIRKEMYINFDLIKPFRKFHDDKSHNGLGLGLFVCKELCSRLKLYFGVEIEGEKISFRVSELS